MPIRREAKRNEGKKGDEPWARRAAQGWKYNKRHTNLHGPCQQHVCAEWSCLIHRLTHCECASRSKPITCHCCPSLYRFASRSRARRERLDYMFCACQRTDLTLHCPSSSHKRPPSLLRLGPKRRCDLSEQLASDFEIVLAGVRRPRLGPRVSSSTGGGKAVLQHAPCVLVTALPAAVPLVTDAHGAAIVALGR